MTMPTIRGRFQPGNTVRAVAAGKAEPPVPTWPRPAATNSPMLLAAEEAGHLRRILAITQHPVLRKVAEERLAELGYSR